MANKYFSVERRFFATNVYSAAIAPPADFDIAAGAWNNRLFSINNREINPNGAILVNRLGLYSNFADGLVQKEHFDRIWVSLTARAYTYLPLTQLTGTVSVTAGTNALVAAGDGAFTTELAANDVITTGGPLGISGKFLYRVASVTDDDNVVLKDYVEQTSAPTTWVKLTSLGSEAFRQIEIRNLNEMSPVDQFLSPSLYAATGVYYISLEIDFLAVVTSLTYMTKSINASYSGDTCFFDAYADIEYTDRG